MEEMDKLRQIFDEQYQVFLKKFKLPIVYQFGDKPDEHFTCCYSQKKFYLTASNPRIGLFGLQHLSVAVSSGHQAEYLGEWQPRFPLRPLYVVHTKEMAVNADISIFLPDLTKTGWHHLCLRLIELGYNSLLFPVSLRQEKYESSLSVTSIFNTLQEYDIKILLQPDFKSKNFTTTNEYSYALKLHFDYLKKQYPQIHAFFWESQTLHPDVGQASKFREMTQKDLVKIEIGQLEAAVGSKPLIFFLPVHSETSAKQQAKWLSLICDDLGKQTILAFPVVSGQAHFDHLVAHPFWDELRKTPDVSATCLLPMINLGAIGQGEGLWPYLNSELIESYLNRCYRHSFVGAIFQIAHLPKEGALLDGMLWAASQNLWRQKPLYLILESWFSARRPELSFTKYQNQLKELCQLIQNLSKIRHDPPKSSEEGKCLVELIFSQLNYLQATFEKEVKKDHHTLTWNDYFKPFARDARNIISYYMTFNQINLPFLKKEEIQEGGFWTKVGSPHEIYLQRPVSSFQQTSMRAIFNESRIE